MRWGLPTDEAIASRIRYSRHSSLSSLVSTSSAAEETCTPLLPFYLSRRWLMAREQRL